MRRCVVEDCTVSSMSTSMALKLNVPRRQRNIAYTQFRPSTPGRSSILAHTTWPPRRKIRPIPPPSAFLIVRTPSLRSISIMTSRLESPSCSSRPLRAVVRRGIGRAVSPSLGGRGKWSPGGIRPGIGWVSLIGVGGAAGP